MSTTPGRAVIPVLRFRERSTVEWLEAALGFTLSEVTPDDDGGLAHVQLWWGDDCIMGSTNPSDGEQIGGASLYLTIATAEEVDELHAQALAAGATEVREPVDQPYGGRGSTIADPEGNQWSIGSYLPTPPG